MGKSLGEIAERVYGSDNYKNRVKVSKILYLYGKRFGLLSSVVFNDKTGEYVDKESGEVIEETITNEYFYSNSLPTPPQTLLGGYRNIVQLKASLNRKELRTYKLIERVGKLLSHLGIRRESIVKQTASIIAKLNVTLTLKFDANVIAAAAALISLIFHGYQVNDFWELIEVQGIDRKKVLHVLRDMRLPRDIANELSIRYIILRSIT